MHKVLVTGGTGFVGHSLLRMLVENSFSVRATYCNTPPAVNEDIDSQIDWVRHDFENENEDYTGLLSNIDIIIHLAGKAHNSDASNNLQQLFRKINVEGTGRLASEAIKAGISHFIFISTVKVHGEKTGLSNDGTIQQFAETDFPAPQDNYAMSKLEAEQVIKDILHNKSVNYTILRPPLVYGPGVKANFLKLIRLASKGTPLPFASIKNKRSMLYVDNLSRAIIRVIERRDISANKTYLVSDVDVSLPQLFRSIARQLNVKARLFPFPVTLLKGLGTLVGKRKTIDRLTDSLLVDSKKFRYDMDWFPETGFDTAIANTIKWYKHNPDL